MPRSDARFEKKAVKDASLEGWLRERAFRQHCALFHNRPFLWHVSDGTKDGFASVASTITVSVEARCRS